MNSELKGKFDDLDDLLSGGYISEAEYAAARENLLMDAGLDVSPRPSGFFKGGLAFQPREERKGGCGCLLMALALLVLLAAGFLALPEGIVKGIPVLGNLLAGQGWREMRQSVSGFIDDLRGNPAPDGTANEPQTPGPEAGQGGEPAVSSDRAQ